MEGNLERLPASCGHYREKQFVYLLDIRVAKVCMPHHEITMLKMALNSMVGDGKREWRLAVGEMAHCDGLVSNGTAQTEYQQQNTCKHNCSNDLNH